MKFDPLHVETEGGGGGDARGNVGKVEGREEEGDEEDGLFESLNDVKKKCYFCNFEI